MSTVDSLGGLVWGPADLQKACVGGGQPLSSKVYHNWVVSLSNSEVQMSGANWGWKRLLSHEASPN